MIDSISKSYQNCDSSFENEHEIDNHIENYFAKPCFIALTVREIYS